MRHLFQSQFWRAGIAGNRLLKRSVERMMTLKKLMWLMAIAAGFTAAIHVSDSLIDMQIARMAAEE